jgi:transcription initiation factor TFIID subunit 5
MSAATPAPSNPPSEPSPPPNANTAATETTTNDAASTEQLIIEYLRSRGHRNAERALREALNLPASGGEDSKESDSEASQEIQTTVSDAELRKHLVPFFQRKDRPAGENALTDASLTLQSLQSSAVTSPTVSALLGNIAPGGADEIISLDPTDKHEGFRDLEAWVDGSLDMYRVSPSACVLQVFD